MGTVYRGLKPVPDSEVKGYYNGSHVSIDDMSGFYGRVSLCLDFIISLPYLFPS